jgi:hypothetical protein
MILAGSVKSSAWDLPGCNATKRTSHKKRGPKPSLVESVPAITAMVTVAATYIGTRNNDDATTTPHDRHRIEAFSRFACGYAVVCGDARQSDVISNLGHLIALRFLPRVRIESSVSDTAHVTARNLRLQIALKEQGLLPRLAQERIG